MSERDNQTTNSCRFNWNDNDHSECPRCHGSRIDPVEIGQPRFVHPLDRELYNSYLNALREGRGKVLPSEADAQICAGRGLPIGSVLDAAMRCHIAARAWSNHHV